jgi:hypothetical protein
MSKASIQIHLENCLTYCGGERRGCQGFKLIGKSGGSSIGAGGGRFQMAPGAASGGAQAAASSWERGIGGGPSQPGERTIPPAPASAPGNGRGAWPCAPCPGSWSAASSPPSAWSSPAGEKWSAPNGSITRSGSGDQAGFSQEFRIRSPPSTAAAGAVILLDTGISIHLYAM